MGFIDRLRGKTKEEQPQETPKEPERIKCFDRYGLEIFITKEEWRLKVLPDVIKSSWSDPNRLYSVLLTAINDGFSADVIEPAEHLYTTDPIPERGACLYSIVLQKNLRLDDAERVLQTYIEKHGETGAVLTNLAKVYAERNETDKADRTLWRALELDPNQENGVGWYWAIQRERLGPQAASEALRKLSALPGSWRAHVWLAREALESNDKERAMALYRESLERQGTEVPALVLQQISGDLGKHGFLNEALALTEPRFEPKVHGLAVGNNLIKVNLDLGRLERATQILNELYALQRPDWKQHLEFWDTEITKAKIAARAPKNTPPEAGLFVFDSPVWLKHDSPVREVFPKSNAAKPLICFLGSSAETGNSSTVAVLQIADAAGRLSRALPLFLQEQVEFLTDAASVALIPRTVNPAALVLTVTAWSDAEAVRYAFTGPFHCAFVVTLHVVASAEPWAVELRLIRTSDGACIATLRESFRRQDLGAAAALISHGLIEIVREKCGAGSRSAGWYEVPEPVNLEGYLLRLEQLMALRSTERDGGEFHGERKVLSGNLTLCLANPNNVTVRTLFVQSILAMQRIRPEVVGEFRDKVTLLQREYKLAEPAQSILQQLLVQAGVCAE